MSRVSVRIHSVVMVASQCELMSCITRIIFLGHILQ